MGIKRTPADVALSNAVRERADWTCECCGKYYPNRDGPGGSQGLHASHFWGRAGKSTRYTGSNVFAHCFGCHQKLSANPHDFRDWAMEQLGLKIYSELKLRANKPMKRPKSDIPLITAHFKEQLAEIKQKRKDGHVGYIDFVEYD